MLEFLSIKSSTVNSLLHFHLPRKEQMQQWFDCGLITLELPGSLKLVIHPIQVKPEAMKFGPIVITTNARLRVSELVAKCIVDSLLKAITSDETFHGVLQLLLERKIPIGNTSFAKKELLIADLTSGLASPSHQAVSFLNAFLAIDGSPLILHNFAPQNKWLFFPGSMADVAGILLIANEELQLFADNAPKGTFEISLPPLSPQWQGGIIPKLTYFEGKPPQSSALVPLGHNVIARPLYELYRKRRTNCTESDQSKFEQLINDHIHLLQTTVNQLFTLSSSPSLSLATLSSLGEFTERMRQQLSSNITHTPLPELVEASASDMFDNMMAELVQEDASPSTPTVQQSVGSKRARN